MGEKDAPPAYSFAMPAGQPQPQYQQPYQPPQYQQPHFQSFPPPAPQPQRQLPPIPRQFPPAFNMYRESTLGARNYTLGEHRNTPLYAVALHSGFSGKPDVVLHNGPSTSRPPLAAVEKSGWSHRGTVHLPPVPELQLGVGTAGRRAAEERFEVSSGLGHRTFTFSIEAGVGATNQREMFEWRHSSGKAVKGLDGTSGGWKLCRMAMEPPAGVERAGFVPGGECGSDGREVVAVWAGATASLSKIMKFQFLGTGASGMLGERWAIMAVMTGLKIWDIERRARQAAQAGSAGGGA